MRQFAPVKSVLFEQRAAGYGSWWSRNVQMGTKKKRHGYFPLAYKAVDIVHSLLKACFWEFGRLT